MNTQSKSNAASHDLLSALRGADCCADFDGWEKRLAEEYRKEHFVVTANAPRKNGNPVTLSITTNGNQWQTIGLMPDEIQRVIDALIPFLPNVKSIHPESKPQDHE